MANAIALCAHGPFAPALLEAAGMVAGVPEGVQAFALLPGMDPFEYRSGIQAFVEEHADDGCLLLVDLFGGTPSNMCASLAARENVEVVAGLSLPMLIEVMTRKDQVSLADLRAMALEAGQASAVDVKQLFMNMRKQSKGE